MDTPSKRGTLGANFALLSNRPVKCDFAERPVVLFSAFCCQLWSWSSMMRRRAHCGESAAMLTRWLTVMDDKSSSAPRSMCRRDEGSRASPGSPGELGSARECVFSSVAQMSSRICFGNSTQPTTIDWRQHLRGRGANDCFRKPATTTLIRFKCDISTRM